MSLTTRNVYNVHGVLLIDRTCIDDHKEVGSNIDILYLVPFMLGDFMSLLSTRPSVFNFQTIYFSPQRMCGSAGSGTAC